MLGSTIFFLIFIPFLAFVLLGLSLLLGPHSAYTHKSAAFECGFSSFRGQNRTEFSISFFIFGLLFLLFDLEILLIFPFGVSSYNNSSYGLVFVVIFLLILTAGFVFEFAKNALEIKSRQTGYLESSNAEVKERKSSNLYTRGGHYISPAISFTQKIFYSTAKASPSSKVLAKPLNSSDDFWKKVYSSDLSDSTNPFIVVNNYLKKVMLEGQIKHPITLQLISSILSFHLKNFCLTQAEFDSLNQINPIRLDLPLKNRGDLIKILGKFSQSGNSKVSGAYVLTNKTNGNSYVGSSLALSNRLSNGYLGPKLGNRKIDLAIKSEGIASFNLDLYILTRRPAKRGGDLIQLHVSQRVVLLFLCILMLRPINL